MFISCILDFFSQNYKFISYIVDFFQIIVSLSHFGIACLYLTILSFYHTILSFWWVERCKIAWIEKSELWENVSITFLRIFSLAEKELPQKSIQMPFEEVLLHYSYYYNTFTFMHLADAFIQSDLHCIQVTVYFFTFDQLLLSLGIEPMILALLAPCSTIWATGKL